MNGGHAFSLLCKKTQRFLTPNGIVSSSGNKQETIDENQSLFSITFYDEITCIVNDKRATYKIG